MFISFENVELKLLLEYSKATASWHIRGSLILKEIKQIMAILFSLHQ